MRKWTRIALSGLVIAAVAACTPGQRTGDKGKKPADSLAHEEIKPFKGHYDTLLLKGAAKDSGLTFLNRRYTREQRQVILALNRIDSTNVRHADTLAVPDSVWAGLSVYTPFPGRVKALDSVKKIIFFANWKAEEHESSVDDEWLLKWNVNVENDQGVGWHLYAMPGYPASHSCMRLLKADAQWLYDWVDEWVMKNNHELAAHGTPTLIFGSYDFKGGKPWLRLLADPEGNRITEEDLTKELEPHLQKILDEQSNRKKITEAEKVDSASVG